MSSSIVILPTSCSWNYDGTKDSAKNDEDEDEDEEGEDIDESLVESERKRILSKYGVEEVHPLKEGDTLPGGVLIVRRGWVEHRAEFSRMKVVKGSLVSVERVNGKDVRVAATERWGGGKKSKITADLYGAARAILQRMYPGHHSESAHVDWWTSFQCNSHSRLFANGDDWEVRFKSSGKDVEEEDKAKGWYFTGGRSEAFE
jgi:hypothetical protein